MLINSEFSELLSLFTKHDVRFLVVGGYAVMKYGEPRFTKDIDLWIATDSRNAQAVYAALREFGAPLAGLTISDFMDTSSFYQMGVAPLRVDIMMSIPGVEFEECWQRRTLVELGDATIPFIGKEDLITAKRASGRPQDLLDAETLLSDPPQIDT
jgi:hypothetical protein